MVIKAATDGEGCGGDDEEATLELANNDESKVGTCYGGIGGE